MVLTDEFVHGLSDSILKTPERHTCINNITNLFFTTGGALNEDYCLLSAAFTFQYWPSHLFNGYLLSFFQTTGVRVTMRMPITCPQHPTRTALHLHMTLIHTLPQ